jgi:hypothetical protein
MPGEIGKSTPGNIRIFVGNVTYDVENIIDKALNMNRTLEHS